jgi:putative transposase
MRKPVFANDQIYHIFNRGVDKRTIFLDDNDHLRFLHQLYELNNEDSVLNVKYYFNRKTMSVEPRTATIPADRGKRLVDILVFTLMPNHYHLMLRQRKENGIVKFMQKVGTGYTMFFNKKHNRSGSLFQGRFKAVHINRNEQLLYLPHYIHTNPLTLNYGGSTSIDFLEEYRWSSFLDYIGIKNFPSITQRDYILEVFGGELKYSLHTDNCLREFSREDIINKLEAAAIK